LTVGGDQLKDKVVERRTQLVRNVSGDQAQISRWKSEALVLGEKPNHVTVDVSLDVNSVRASLDRPGFIVEFCKVAYGPFNLGFDTV
jgi:hypothetical protein